MKIYCNPNNTVLHFAFYHFDLHTGNKFDWARSTITVYSNFLFFPSFYLKSRCNNWHRNDQDVLIINACETNRSEGHLPKGNLIQTLTRCDHHHPPHLTIRRQQLFSIFNWQKDKNIEKYFGPLRYFSEQFNDTTIILKLKLKFEALNHWHSNWDWHCIGNLAWDILLGPSITDIQLKPHNRALAIFAIFSTMATFRWFYHYQYRVKRSKTQLSF